MEPMLLHVFKIVMAIKKMDFEANGMPKESYGVSNNKMLMGPPTWQESKFEIKRDTTIHIIM